MAPPSDPVVRSIPNRTGNCPGHTEQSPGKPQIPGQPERRLGTDGDLIAAGPVSLEPCHRIHRSKIGVPGDYLSSELTLEGRKAQRSLPVRPKHQLHDAGAKTALTIKEQDGLVLHIHMRLPQERRSMIPALLRQPKAHRQFRAGIFAILSGMVLAGCTHTTNLLNPTTPAFLGSYAATTDSVDAGELRVVSFNVKLGRNIPGAISVLEKSPLAGADVIALQEMDEVGVERIARTMKLNYAYYPGSIHPTDDRYFGPALLSRWPIERSWKLILPHEGRLRHQQRTATGAILRVGDHRVLAYAVHLETQLKISEQGRRDQVQTILDDAAGFSGPTVIAGDFNSEGIGPFLVRNGYRWLTERVGPSITMFSWDHIFVRGLEPRQAGVMHDVHGASDHKPVWAVATRMEPAAQRSASR
jgi:endonuclease/exonuclease/phosphatase family metal-dependent hydrolase